MFPDFEVDADELRRATSALSATTARVTAATSEAPTIPRVPRWLTVDAATLAAAAARRHLELLGSDFDRTAERMRLAADAYERADARTAARLRSSR